MIKSDTHVINYTRGVYIYHTRHFISEKMALVYANVFINTKFHGCSYNCYNDVVKYCPEVLKKSEIIIPKFISSLIIPTTT